MSQIEEQGSKPYLICYKCSTMFVNFKGGNCKKHHFCLQCISPDSKCHLCNLVSFSDDEEQPEKMQSQQLVKMFSEGSISAIGKADNPQEKKEESSEQLILESLKTKQLFSNSESKETKVTANTTEVNEIQPFENNHKDTAIILHPSFIDLQRKNEMLEEQVFQLKKMKEDYESLKIKSKQLAKKLEYNERMSISQKENYLFELAQLRTQLETHKEKQAKEKHERDQLSNNLSMVKKLIDNYYKMLILHFQQINHICTYGITMEKLKMVKMLISNFNNITEGNTQIASIISSNQQIISSYISSDIEIFKKEIATMPISFNLFSGDSGRKIKVILQKLKLYKEIMGVQAIVQAFVDQIADKINNFLRTVVSKNISNNKTSKNEYIIIEYLNKFLTFQEHFEEEIKIISEKCSANQKVIRCHLLQNFKKIENMYLSLGLGNTETVKTLHTNEEKINIMIKMVINIRVITKNEKYQLYFERQTSRKINDFKDQINRTLITMRNILLKEINKKETINDYRLNYGYFNSLFKIKDFDMIWDAEQNFYHNFKFTQLYEATKSRNQILKKVKVHQIHQIISEEKIDLDTLSLQINDLVANQQMRSALVCRIKQIFMKKLLKMNRLNEFSDISFNEFDQYKQFHHDVTELQKIINPIHFFEGHIDFTDYYNIIEEKINIFAKFLKEKFNYLLQNYNSQEFQQIEKEIKYYANFQTQFFKPQFNNKYRQFKRQVKKSLQNLNIQKRDSYFNTLLELMQQSKQFILTFVQSSQICSDDYEKLKKFRKAFTSNQEELIEKKIDLDIEARIIQLKTQQWEKGNFQSIEEKVLRLNIEKLTFNQQNKYRQKLQKNRCQIEEAMNKKMEEIKVKLGEEENFIIENLLPLIRKEEDSNFAYVKRYFDLLRDHLNFLLEKQFKQISKRSQFLEEHIYKISFKNEKSLRIRQMYGLLQYKTYKVQSDNIPTLENNLFKEFQQALFVSKKAISYAEQIDELINLYVFFIKEISKTFLSAKTVESIKSFFSKHSNNLNNILSQILKQINLNKQVQEITSQQILMTNLSKAKILHNLLTKFTPETQQMLNFRSIIKNFNERIINWELLLKNYSFTETLSKNNFSDTQITTNLEETDKMAKILLNIQEYSNKNAILLSNRVLNLQFYEIKFQDLMSNLQISWRQFYSMNIREELTGIFNINQKISQKCKMFIKVKNIVKQKRFKTFGFITNQQYDIKHYLVEECKKICQQTQRLLQECNDEYSRYIIEIKDKKADTERKLLNQRESITKLYQEKIHLINVQLFIIEENEAEESEEVAQKQATIENLKKTMLKEIKEIQTQYKKITDQLQNLYRLKVQKLFHKIIDNMRVLEKISVQFAQQQIKKTMEKFIDKIFNEIQQSNQRIKDQLIEQFYEKSKTCDLVAYIVQQKNIFEELRIEIFNNKVKHQDEHYVVKNCPQISSLTEAEKNAYVANYNRYKEEVQSVQKQYKDRRTEQKLTQIVQRTISEASNVSTPILLGRIFGIESILRIKHKQVLKFIRNPHPAQIIAILLLIQPNKDKNAANIKDITNGMAEVKTGEGKSVVLAGLCCLLAMRGFYAYCACYSAYLSLRDQKQYRRLFETLGVGDKIKYGTFADHCKDLLDEKGKFYFKEIIRECLLNRNQTVDIKYASYLQRLEQIFEKNGETKRILIIDEVDVFFQERYFGQFYRPAISLDYQCIKDLIKFIWQHHEQCKIAKGKQKLKQKIKNTTYYKQLLMNWSHLSALFDNQLQGMMAAAADPRHTYEFQDQKIVYRYNDIIEEEMNNGLKTVFTACFERDRHKVNEQFYEKTLKLSLIISQFSYAELPNYFDHILGVSGTLQTLAKSRKQIMMQKYKVKGFYVLPSIYGKTRRTIYEPLVIQDNYQATLVDKIIEQSLKGRPVMVFFKSSKYMKQVHQSEKVKTNLTDCCFLNEDEAQHVRDSTIRLAGRRGRVTFMTSYFSRGTDFMIEDKDLIKAGGFHVIQTYISKDQSDYVQVYGRTARQGKNGSFQMIIKADDLAEFDINITQNTEIFAQIKGAWEKKDEIEGEKLKNKIEKAAVVHDKSYGVIKSLSKGTKFLTQQIQRLNYVKVAAAKNIKSIIVVDGTGSMGNVLQKLREVIAEAIVNTDITIANNNVNASFEQQIIIYRNYSSFQLILQCSGFSNDPVFLTQWANRIVPDGGDGNEAIEVAFKKINQMESVDQIIIIGDARGNTLAEMIEKRGQVHPDEQLWTDMNIPFVESPEAQLETLINRNIPIHTLFIPKKKPAQTAILAQYFGEISRRSGGTCQEFHVNNANASTILSDFIASSVLNQVGGQQLVDDYFRMRRG